VNWSEKRVEGVGPTPAKLMLIGEAPGQHEDEQGIPFVGMAGRVLDDMLLEAGLDRADIYITNIAKNRPNNNNFDNFTEEYLAKAKAEIQEEIAIVRPNAIVICGENALNVLTELKGITKWRGSVLSTRVGKVLPIIHPAAIIREWSFRPATVADLIKARRECDYPEIRCQQRNLITMPKYDDILLYLSSIKRDKHKVAFDIETETDQICCISFATSSTESMCIPFWFGSSGSFWSEEQEQMIWHKIKEVLEDETIEKVAQNAQYDMTVLYEKYGIRVNGLWLDTMIAFHSMYPELPKGLDFLCSLYTDQLYYKYLRRTDSMQDFFRYNCLDSAITYECSKKIYAEMVEAKMVDFYYEHMHSLIYPLMDITHTGVRIDTDEKKKAITQYKEEIESLGKALTLAVGHELNVNSPKQMQKWLYDELKLPKKFKSRKGKGTKTITTDEEALDDLYRETHNESLKIVIDIREHKKILSTYLEVKYDKEADGSERARTSYLITGTETGRLSSRETVFGTGTNLQNIPKGIARRIFVPDDGKIFVNADLSQAEARVVAYLASDERLIKVFESGGDIHCKNAAGIFRKSEGEVTSEERELAKRVIHASHYGMGPITFAKTAQIPVANAKRLLNLYFSEYPRIKIWHMQVAAQVRKTRTLTTPFGRKRTFFNRWSESLVKEALAYVPQSTVADLLNLGLRRLYAIYKGTDTNLLLQIHDAVLLQTPQVGWEEVARKVKETLTIPVLVGNRTLVIPVDVSVGSDWDGLQKIKL
jgi:DNA polymerase-1